MSIPVKINHTEVGLDRLITKFKDKPIVVGLLKSYLDEFNTLEDLFFQLLEDRGIYTAEGQQLDILGALFNVPRLGLADSTYRSAILLKISQKDDDGTTEVFMDRLRIASNSDVVDFWEHESGDVHALIGAGFNQSIYSQLENTVPAGVNLVLYIDDLGDSLKLSELVYLGSDLQVNEDGLSTISDLQVDLNGAGNLADLQVQSSETPITDSTYLPEIQDPQGVHLLAEIINRDYYSITGNFVFDDGSYMLDQSGNFLLWESYTF